MTGRTVTGHDAPMTLAMPLLVGFWRRTSIRARLLIGMALAMLPLAILGAWPPLVTPPANDVGESLAAASSRIRLLIDHAEALLRQQTRGRAEGATGCEALLTRLAGAHAIAFASLSASGVMTCPAAPATEAAMSALGRLARDTLGSSELAIGAPLPRGSGGGLFLPLAVAGASGDSAATLLSLGPDPSATALSLLWRGPDRARICRLVPFGAADSIDACADLPPREVLCPGASAGDTATLCLSSPIGPSLTLVTLVPAGAATRPRPPGAGRIGLALALLASALLANAWLTTQLITRPLAALASAIATWRDRGVFPVSARPLPAAELAEVETAFIQATWRLQEGEATLRTALAKHELLMKEIHHRVKNNLQIVASLLNLQAGRLKQPEARSEFQAARDRVRALATLHRHLYGQGELHTIDMRDFLEELCEQLFQAMGETRGRRIALSIEASSVQVSSDQAVPISLIITEAVSNALKYAFPGGRSGHVAVRFIVDGDEAELTIEDDGIGLPPGRVETETGPRDGLGLQLIRGFARQLKAVLTVAHESGTQYKIRLRLLAEADVEESVA